MTRRHRAAAVLLTGVFCTSVAFGCNDHNADRKAQEPERSSRPLSQPRGEEPNSFEARSGERSPAYGATSGGPSGDVSGFSDHRAQVRVVATELESVPVLIPSTVVLAAGPDRDLQLSNQGPSDRRFVIEGLGVSQNVPAGEETTIRLPRLEPNSIYAIRIEAATPTATTTQPPANPEVPGSAQPDTGSAQPMQAPRETPPQGGASAEASGAMQHGTLIVLGAIPERSTS